MNKEELLELKNIKQKELDEIEKQLNEVNNQEFIKVEDYMGKFYNIDNSNSYFHVRGYNPNNGELFGTEVIFLPDSLEIYQETKTIDEGKYTEVSEEQMKKCIKKQIEQLIKKFMR